MIFTDFPGSTGAASIHTLRVETVRYSRRSVSTADLRPHGSAPIVVFDVLCHGRMHLQFTEANLRLVRAAMPKQATSET